MKMTCLALLLQEEEEEEREPCHQGQLELAEHQKYLSRMDQSLLRLEGVELAEVVVVEQGRLPN